MKCENCGNELEPHDEVILVKIGFLGKDGEEIEQVEKVEWKHADGFVQSDDDGSAFPGEVNHVLEPRG